LVGGRILSKRRKVDIPRCTIGERNSGHSRPRREKRAG
jgi:hypothetical protein